MAYFISSDQMSNEMMLSLMYDSIKKSLDNEKEEHDTIDQLARAGVGIVLGDIERNMVGVYLLLAVYMVRRCHEPIENVVNYVREQSLISACFKRFMETPPDDISNAVTQVRFTLEENGELTVVAGETSDEQKLGFLSGLLSDLTVAVLNNASLGALYQKAYKEFYPDEIAPLLVLMLVQRFSYSFEKATLLAQQQKALGVAFEESLKEIGRSVVDKSMGETCSTSVN